MKSESPVPFPDFRLDEGIPRRHGTGCPPPAGGADMRRGFGSLARFPGRARGAEGKRVPCGLLREGQSDTQKRPALRRALQAVEKPLVLERTAFLASFGRSQRSRNMLRHKALGRRKEACALWALGPEGAKATWRRGAKRAAGAASARRDIEQPMIPLHPALSHSSSVTPRSPPCSPSRLPPPSPRRPSAPSPAAGPYPAYPARALPAPRAPSAG